MTIRSRINNKLRKGMIIILSGFALYIAGIVYNVLNDTNARLVISLIGFGLAFVGMSYAFFGIRCPKCNNIFGHIAIYKGPFIPDSILAMSKKIKYCPFCGVDVDTEINA